jgi:Zn-dependent membrane protease YugP
MGYLIILALVLALVFGPAVWAKSVLKRYSVQRGDYPGTGGELARHLLDRMGMQEVVVEETATGDHYDPRSKTVRLTEPNMNSSSLTAVTVAAHEVGHAIQDHTGYAPLRLRTRLVGFAQGAEKLGAFMLVAMPFVAMLTRAPSGGLMMLAAGLLSFGTAVVVHLITLPVELDASFRRALPILATGYIPERDRPAARRILTACALTYVAGSLASMLNLWRWIAILRR